MLGRIDDFDRFLKQVKRARQEIKSDRPDFWKKNRVNFKNNIKTLIGFYKFPEGWIVNTIASNFLLDKEVMPYDTDVWSFSDVVSATKEQGFNIIIFFNKSDLEFLSLPALLPIVAHEAEHVFQAPNNTKKYVLATIDDDISREFEKGADAEVKKYSEEFRRENVLEKIVYCFDKENWKGAKKMADYLYKEAENAFGGGYDQEMEKDEYTTFMKAYEEKDINIFIDYFIESINKEMRQLEEKKE
ncbi:MAG: hypothetical protein WCI72_03005 [archaeon]